MKSQTSNLKLVDEFFIFNKFLVSQVHQTSFQNLYLIDENLSIFRKKQELIRAKRAYLANLANLYEAEVIYNNNSMKEKKKDKMVTQTMSSNDSQDIKASFSNYSAKPNYSNHFSSESYSDTPKKNNDNAFFQAPNNNYNNKYRSFQVKSNEESDDEDFQSNYFRKSFQVSRSPMRRLDDVDDQPNIAFLYSSRL